MKKILTLCLFMFSFSTLAIAAEGDENSGQTTETTEEGPENMPIISQKKLKAAAQVTIGYSISEGKKKNKQGEVSW